MASRTLHIGATKSYVVGLIHRFGAKGVMREWDGSDEEAIQAVQDDSREVFADCGCRKNSDGSCSGEPMTADAVDPSAQHRER